MSIKLPTSDEKRLETLDLIHLLSSRAPEPEAPTPDGSAAPEAATRLPAVQLSPELTERVETCRQALRRLTHEFEALQAELKTQRQIRDSNASRVRAGIKNYWSSLSYYAETHPNAVPPMAFYGVPSGAVAELTPTQALSTAERILKAVEEAPDAGHPVITLGGGQAIFVNAIDRLRESLTVLAYAAQDKVTNKRERVETRQACHTLLGDVAATLRLAFRGYPAAEARDEIRAYGFRYRFDPVDASSDEGSAASEGEPTSDVTDANQTPEESALVAEVSPEALTSLG